MTQHGVRFALRNGRGRSPARLIQLGNAAFRQAFSDPTNVRLDLERLLADVFVEPASSPAITAALVAE